MNKLALQVVGLCSGGLIFGGCSNRSTFACINPSHSSSRTSPGALLSRPLHQLNSNFIAFYFGALPGNFYLSIEENCPGGRANVSLINRNLQELL
jgi:hypothetical protein